MSHTESKTEAWYIVKQDNGQCSIVPGSEAESPKPEPQPEIEEPPALERWGPYASQSEAIARRVGLIRAGKCQPA
ncbi:hypothetical protein [Stenomitos frigidus]|uniref:DDE transposase family protein n=1 Tax=Stenomitos frigidus ULC18 TaxID=2107698 RepID=A0A2T1DTP6_9CYAN|nr:hypothetical protein [Stenomitos frigidus]PSB23801.1 hypothetical protein C7B82_30200 [Stenomitos frigidus ULC18]